MNFLSSKIYETENTLSNYISNNLESIKENLNNLKIIVNENYMKISEYSPKQKIQITQNKIVSLAKNNQIFIKNKINSINQNISLLKRIIQSSSVEKNLKKGYSILKYKQNLIKDLKTLRGVDEFSVKMHDGEILIKK